ncbi:MAG TPA: hypothetical protein PK177_22640, partial [Burkholderiaceae bacterium]|nr:hypothetical protein [Burkholderiaceae bacterium]
RCARFQPKAALLGAAHSAVHDTPACRSGRFGRSSGGTPGTVLACSSFARHSRATDADTLLWRCSLGALLFSSQSTHAFARPTPLPAPNTAGPDRRFHAPRVTRRAVRN